MVYVTSDLHGYSLEKFLSLLKSVDFSDDDFLYILGDVVDRGLHGAELLLWLTQQTNVELILGNHEILLLACSFLFEEATEESLDQLSIEKLQLVENWIQNGGIPTINGFRKLLSVDHESVAGILDYLRDCPLYECIQVNKHKFILVHSGLENFSVSRSLDSYLPDELIMARPNLNTNYFQDPTISVIFGHTPTAFLDLNFTGKALHAGSWICVDTGTFLGNSPVLLRLDDMAEFYYT